MVHRDFLFHLKCKKGDSVEEGRMKHFMKTQLKTLLTTPLSAEYLDRNSWKFGVVTI